MRTASRLNTDWLLATEIHKLETRLWRQAQRDHLRVIMMTSAARREGKSTTVAYLATALGLYPDRRILAMDLDFREPRLNSHFGLDVQHGIGAVILGECSLQEAITKTDLPNLDLLVPMGSGEQPHLLLKTQQLASILDSVRRDYDLTIVDVPALIPVADASMVMPLTDGVILVAMAGKTTKPQLRRAWEICTGMEANILGLVVGNLKDAMPDYGHDRYYYAYKNSDGPSEHNSQSDVHN